MYLEILSDRQRAIEFISGTRLRRPANWEELPRSERAAFAELRRLQGLLLSDQELRLPKEVFPGVVELTSDRSSQSLN
ncbi:MAG: hypothetical protein BAA04_08245 [Firmicutes bacterium ZCTH02-B6]|nr:MAG: hypothetical protein BAA04_08245 [Firmicutes bacterium ZCTH02-B6]